MKDRELEDHDDGNCKVDKDCKPGHVCRPVGFSYQKECRKYQGICGFWGGKRCEPDEICIQDEDIADSGYCKKDPDFEQSLDGCNVDEDCKSDEKCIIKGSEDLDFDHMGTALGPRICKKEPKWCLNDKYCQMENGEKCVGVSQDCFDCPPTAGYVSMLHLHIPYIF